MSGTPVRALSHIGICVSDIERSGRFYTEALGFEFQKKLEFGAPFHTLAEVPEVKARAAFYKRDGLRIELLCYETPAHLGPAERRPMHQLGLTHMAIVVDDLDAAIERIVEYGGRAHPETRVQSPAGELLFCTDPDGTRLEVWRKPT